MLSGFGFSLAEADVSSVRFENANVFVTLVFSERSGELHFGIGLLDDLYNGQERPFNLGEVRVVEPSIDREFTFLQAMTPESYQSSVSRVASILHDYGVGALKGNRAAFHSLAELRETESSRYMTEMEFRHARAEAANAWNERKFARFVELMEPFRDSLSKSEEKKLTIAKSSLSN